MREVRLRYRIEWFDPVTFREQRPMYEYDKDSAERLAKVAGKDCGYITFITEEEV